MGYTHYWYRQAEIPEDQWQGFIADCLLIAEHRPTYKGQPVVLDDGARIESDIVQFNGAGLDGWEPFMIQRVFTTAGKAPEGDGLYFASCKTALKPYDIVVVACLTALLANCHPVRLDSDGTPASRLAGRTLYHTATGRVAPDWMTDHE